MMKKKNTSLGFLFFIILTSYVSYTNTSQIKESNQTITPLTKDEQSIFQLDQDSDTLKNKQNETALILFSKIESTSSIYEEEIEKIYGISGLNIPEENLDQIKKTYCYLEFLTKIEKIKNNQEYAQQKNLFDLFIQPQTEGQPFFPTIDLMNNNDWKLISITKEDIINSLIWQTCLQGIICDSMDNINSTIHDIIEAENQISSFLQNIETIYPTQNYTELRLYLESIQLQLFLQSKQHAYYTNQSNNFSNLTQNKLNEAIIQFKTTDFYIYSHNIETLKATSNQVSNTTKPAIIPSPAQEQILFYFMFLYIQSTLYDTLNTKNLQTMLTATNMQSITPNFFSYNTTDFIYLNDFLILKELIEENKENPIITTISIAATNDEQNQASITDIKNNINQNEINSLIDRSKKNELTEEEINKNLVEKIFTQDFPTNSIFENSIDQIYGPSGLQLSEKIIKKIKNVYCYLEFLAKIDKVSKNKNFIQYASDFKQFIDASSDNILLMPTQDLTQSNGWKSIKITEQDILESSAWQAFLKLMICDSFDNSAQFIDNIREVNLQMTGYLANIEAAYTDDEFTQMRLYSESIQLYENLQLNQKKSYLEECKDWKKIDNNKLIKAIDTFKNDELYQSIYYSNSQQDQKSINNSKLTEQTKQIICSFFMLMNIQNDVYESMTLENLASTIHQQNLNSFSPNFFRYKIDDFIYLHDYLTLTKLIKTNKQNLTLSESNDNYDSQENEEEENTIIIQATKNPFKNTHKKTTQSFKKINKGIKKIIQDSDLDKKITNTTQLIGNKTGQKITKTTTDINNGIGRMGKNLATGFIKMSGNFAYGFVMIGGSKNAAEKARHETVKKMNAHKGVLTKILAVAAVITIALVIMTIGSPLLLIPAMIFAPGQITSSMVVDKRVREPVVKGMMVIMMPILLGMEKMTDAFTQGFIEMSAGLTYAGCMIAVGLHPQANINPQLEANKVRAKLNKHRGALNIVMSIVITVLTTVVIIVCSAGIGAAYTAAVDAGFFGAQAAAASATAASTAATSAATTASATAVTTTATEANAIATATTARTAARFAAIRAANTGLTGPAKQAAQIAAKQTAQTAANAAAQQTAATTARKAAEIAAKEAAEVAAQATAKATARQAALAATKQLAVKQAEEVAAKQALQMTIKQGGNIAAKQALVKQAAMSRVAAQQAVKQTSENAIKQSAQLTIKQASYKITQANVQKALADKSFQQIASATAKQSGAQATLGASSQTSSSTIARESLETSLTNSQQFANNATKQLTEKELAKQLAKNYFDEAAQVLKNTQTSLAKDPNNVFAQAAVKAAQKNMATATTKNNLATQELAQAATKNSIKQAELAGIKSVANNSAFKNSYITSSEFAAKKAAYQTGDITDQELIKAAQQIQKTRQAQLSGMSSYKAAKTSQLHGDSISKSLAAGIRQELVTYSFVIGQALNAGFGVFSALGAVNQDEIAAMQAEQEKKSIKTLWKFVENNKIAIRQDQKNFADELHKKHRAAVKNQAFNLQYYKNFLNSSVNLTQQQIAQILAEQQINLLTPNENGLRAADIGSSWGLQTKFVYLYPSQGFISTTLGRPEFPYAQEVAQAPLTVKEIQKENSNNLGEEQVESTKLWFNQRAVAIAQKETNKPLQVEIKFRVIYNINTAYHVGLYLGGKYHDYNSPEYVKSLQDTGLTDINEAHLAKMFVIKRDTPTQKPSCAVYENEGKEWIIDEPLNGIKINTSSIYHMNANLDNSKLTVNFWQEDNPSNKITKTITVTPCDQRTFGVIFSGIAIEWGVVQPNLPIIENDQARSQLNRPTEIEREKIAKNQRNLTSLSTITQETNESNIKLINPDQQNSNISSLQLQAAEKAIIEITNNKNTFIQNTQSPIIPDQVNTTQENEASQTLYRLEKPTIENSSISENSMTQTTQNISNDQFIIAGHAGLSL